VRAPLSVRVLSFTRAWPKPDTTAWLVEQASRHVVVRSSLKYARPSSDRVTIQTSSRYGWCAVGSRRLKLLTLLHHRRHSRAFGPGVWNGWEGAAHPHAFIMRPSRYSPAGFFRGVNRAAGRVAIGAVPELRHALHPTGPGRPEIDAYMARHYPAYWLKVDPAAEGRAIARFVRQAGGFRQNRSPPPVSFDAGGAGVTELEPLARAPNHSRGCSSIIGGAPCAMAAPISWDAQNLHHHPTPPRA